MLNVLKVLFITLHNVDRIPRFSQQKLTYDIDKNNTSNHVQEFTIAKEVLQSLNKIETYFPIKKLFGAIDSKPFLSWLYN